MADEPDDAPRCEECGTVLTPREIEHALDTGGPALCAPHAAEVLPLPAEDDEIAGG